MCDEPVAVDEPLVIVTDEDAVADVKLRSLQRENPFQPDSPLSHQADDIIKASTITRSYIEMHDPSVEGDSPRSSAPCSPDGQQPVEEMMVASSASPNVQAAPPVSSPSGGVEARSNGEAEQATDVSTDDKKSKKKKKKKKKGCTIL